MFLFLSCLAFDKNFFTPKFFQTIVEYSVTYICMYKAVNLHTHSHGEYTPLYIVIPCCYYTQQINNSNSNLYYSQLFAHYMAELNKIKLAT